MLVAFGWSQYVTWTQFQANRIFVADAGIFDHLCSSPWHGRWMMSPIHWHADVTQFAVHFMPIVVLIAPFYLIADHILTYLAFQNAALVMAAVPLALWARRLTGDGWVALAIALLYLANHFTGSIHLANHIEAIGLVGMFTAFWACERRAVWPYIGGVLWALAVKESYAVIVGLYGLHLAVESLRDRTLRPWAAWTLVAAAGWWLFAWATIRLSGADIMIATEAQPLVRFESMGDTHGAVFLYLLTHPVETLGRIFRRPVFDMLLSGGLIALADWRAVGLVVLGVGIYGVADDALVRNLHYYYGYPGVVMLFYCTVRGAARLLEWAGTDEHGPTRTGTEAAPGQAGVGTGLARRGRLARGALMTVCVVVALVSLGLPTRTDGRRRVPYEVTEHHRLAAEVARQIPRDAAVAAQYELFNKVPNRRVKLPMRLVFLDRVEYVFLDQTVFPGDLVGPEKRAEREALFARLASDEWAVDLEVDGYVILRRAR